MTVVIDASVVVPACTSDGGFTRYRGEELVAPPLLWSEVRSALHASAWRGTISWTIARLARDKLEQAPIASRSHRRLGSEAWRLADELSWAKTYDAEYLALARLLGCPLVTLDGRMRRAAGRLGIALPGGP